MGPRRGICGEKRQGLKQRHAVTSHDTGKTMGKAWEKPRKIRVEWILGRTFRQFVSGNEKYSDDERGVNGFSWCFCQVSIDFNGNFNETIPMSLFSSMQCLVIAYSHTNTLIAMKIGDSNGSTLYWICSMMVNISCPSQMWNILGLPIKMVKKKGGFSYLSSADKSLRSTSPSTNYQLSSQ